MKKMKVWLIREYFPTLIQIGKTIYEMESMKTLSGGKVPKYARCIGETNENSWRSARKIYRNYAEKML